MKDISELQKKVRQIEIVSSRIVTEQMAGEYHSVFKGQGMEFEEVRPYIPGDDIRSIDWNVTARMGAPHIKRYREEREMTALIIADVSASCRFGARVEFKSELMAEITAVLAFATTANNDRVGLVLASDQIELAIPARKGRRHILRLVREALGFEPRSSGTNLSLALDHVRRMLHRKAIIFILSDFLDTGIETALAGIARRHDVIAVAVDDPLERELPDVGLMDLVDPESGEIMTVDTGDAAFRRRYRAEQERRVEDRRRMMNKHDIGVIELQNGKPYTMELIRFFRRRAGRRR